MQRILVMGSSGSGKSTFALRLSAITGMPIVSLDALFWKPGWVPSENAEFERRVTEAVQMPRWIMDGGFISNGAGELRRLAEHAALLADRDREVVAAGREPLIAERRAPRRSAAAGPDADRTACAAGADLQ